MTVSLLWPGAGGKFPLAGITGCCRADGVAWLGRPGQPNDVVAAFGAVRALRIALAVGGGVDAAQTVAALASAAGCPILVVAGHDGGLTVAAAGLSGLLAPTSTGVLRPLVPRDHPMLTGRGGALVLPMPPPALVAEMHGVELEGKSMDEVRARCAEVLWTAG